MSIASAEATGSECLSSYTTCDKHRNEQIEKFCDTHNALICRLCEVIGHKTCGKATIKDKSKETNQKSNIDDFLKIFQSLETGINTLKSQGTSNKKTLLSKLQQSYDTVQRTRKQIDAHFDRLVKSITDSLRTLEQEILAPEESLIKACELSIHEIEKEIKQLKACESTGDDEIIFVGRTKAVPAFEQFQQSYTNLKAESVQRYPVVLINSEISALLAQLQEFGKIADHMELDTNIDDKRSVSTSGATFLPDGRLVVSSTYPSGLLLYTANGCKVCALTTNSIHELAAISDSLLAATVPEKRQIFLIRIDENSLSVVRKIKTDRPCYGIGVFKDKLYVTCHIGGAVLGDGQLVVLSMDGKTLYRCRASGDIRFQQPECLHVDKVNSKIFVSDAGTGNIIIVSEDVRKISRLEVDLPQKPRGICQDEQGRLIIALHNSICFVDGLRIVANVSIPWTYPSYLAYREEDGGLFVGGLAKHSVFIYWLKL